MSKLARNFTAIAFAATLAPWAAFADVAWDLPTTYAIGNPHTQSYISFAKSVDEKTQGSVKITVHAGGGLGFKGPEMIALLRDGIVPIGGVTPQLAMGEFPLGGFALLPALTANLEDASLLLDTARPYLTEAFAAEDQKLLYMTPWTGMGLFTKSAVSAPSDLKGMKIRVGDRNSVDFITALGGEAVSMPWGDVIAALSSGMIDGVATSAQSGVDGRLWEFLGHFTKADWSFALEALVVNQGAFDKLTETEQASITAAAAEVEAVAWTQTKEQEAALVQTLIDNGIKVAEADPELREASRAAAQPIWDAWLATTGEQGKDLLDATLARLQAK